jgi:hypothetical protein
VKILKTIDTSCNFSSIYCWSVYIFVIAIFILATGSGLYFPSLATAFFHLSSPARWDLLTYNDDRLAP